MPENWTVDGYDLSQHAHDIETFDGLDDIAEVAGSDAALAAMHGSVWGKKYYGVAKKTIAMQVSTADPVTGIMPAVNDRDANRANYDRNLDSLLRVFSRRSRLLDVRRTMSNGQVKQAFAECVGSINPQRVGLDAGKVAFTLNLPFSFWQDAVDIQSIEYATNPSFQLNEFKDATAPMADLKYTHKGPWTSIRVEDLESGAYYQYSKPGAAGHTITFDAGAMTITGGGGHVVDMAQFIHDGSATFLTLHPIHTGLGLSFTATGSTAATTLKVVGRRKFLR